MQLQGCNKLKIFQSSLRNSMQLQDYIINDIKPLNKIPTNQLHSIKERQKIIPTEQ